MPRPRQRIVTCDCLDCREDVALGPIAPEATSTAANEAAARQEPPPKSLLILVSGLLRPGDGEATPSSLEAATAPHLDKCAQQGSLNLIACRPKAHDRSAGLAELRELLGLHVVSCGGTSGRRQGGTGRPPRHADCALRLRAAGGWRRGAGAAADAAGQVRCQGGPPAQRCFEPAAAAASGSRRRRRCLAPTRPAALRWRAGSRGCRPCWPATTPSTSASRGQRGCEPAACSAAAEAASRATPRARWRGRTLGCPARPLWPSRCCRSWVGPPRSPAGPPCLAVLCWVGAGSRAATAGISGARPGRLQLLAAGPLPPNGLGAAPPPGLVLSVAEAGGGGGAASSQPAWLTSGAAGPQGPAERRCRRCHGLPVGAARLRNTAQLWTLLIIRSASIDRFAAPGAPSARCSKCQPQAAATPD
jgi:hypothetical protein